MDTANLLVVIQLKHGQLVQNTTPTMSILQLMYAETRNMTPTMVMLGYRKSKPRTLKLLHSISSTLVCAHLLRYVYSKGKDLGGNDYNNNGHQEYVDQRSGQLC